MDNIVNKLAAKNNAVLSQRAQRRDSQRSAYDSSAIQRSFSGEPAAWREPRIMSHEGPNDYKLPLNQSKKKASSRGRISYSRGLTSSWDNPLNTWKNQPLDIIYEDGNTGKPNAQQKAILEKYYKPQPKGQQMPLSRRLLTPLTPDNGIIFLNEDKMIHNPWNMKTPPPPMWGEESSDDDREDGEAFYDLNNDSAAHSR